MCYCGGTIAVPTAPGLGVKLDRDKLGRVSRDVPAPGQLSVRSGSAAAGLDAARSPTRDGLIPKTTGCRRFRGDGEGPRAHRCFSCSALSVAPRRRRAARRDGLRALASLSSRDGCAAARGVSACVRARVRGREFADARVIRDELTLALRGLLDTHGDASTARRAAIAV